MGNKMWKESEDKKMLAIFDNYKDEMSGYTDKEIFAFMALESTNGRTAKAIEQRIYKLKSAGVEADTMSGHNEFLEGIQALTQAYHEMALENRQLKKRVEELEQNQKDYEVMARVMDQARKLVVSQELGEHEKPRFKMDQNGNLNRV